LREVAARLDGAQVRWLLWKGPAIALQAWGDATLRASSDLDIVVVPEDRSRALDCLRAGGWRAKDGFTAAQERAAHSATRAFPLARGADEQLELHWAFAGRHLPTWAEVAAVHARAEVLDLGGVAVRAPAESDALLLLACHASKHGWSQAEEVVSFARLAARWPSALGPTVRHAARAGVSRPVRLAIELVRRLLGRSALDIATEHRDESIASLARECIARMCAGDGAWRETHRWTLGLLDRPADRLRYLATALIAPTPTDVRWVRLPDALAAAYPAVRVARLALRTAGVRGTAGE
jgi:hypothetical protein